MPTYPSRCCQWFRVADRHDSLHFVSSVSFNRTTGSLALWSHTPFFVFFQNQSVLPCVLFFRNGFHLAALPSSPDPESNHSSAAPSQRSLDSFGLHSLTKFSCCQICTRWALERVCAAPWFLPIPEDGLLLWLQQFSTRLAASSQIENFSNLVSYPSLILWG